MSPIPVASTWRLALILGALSMFGPFAIDTVFPAFGVIGRDFSATPFAVQQTITAYLVPYAVMSLVHGPLSDVFGRRPVIIGGATLFMLASVGCALSASLEELLLWRAVQGMTAGAGQIVGRAIIRDCVEGPAAQRLMALTSMIFTMAPAFAPIAGGWILAVGEWHMIFWALAVFTLLLIIATLAFLPETHPVEMRVAFRWRSIFHDNFALLRNPQLLRLGLAGGFNFAALFVYVASAPVFVMEHLGLNEQQFGWFFVPMIAGMSLGALVSSRLAGRMHADQAVRLGFLLCALAGVINVVVTLGWKLGAPWAVLPITLNAFGIAIVFPVLMLAILDMYPRQRGAASSMQQVTGLSVNTLVAALLSPLVSHHRLGLAVSSISLTAIAWLLWRSYRNRVVQEPRLPAGAEVAALEPADRL